MNTKTQNRVTLTNEEIVNAFESKGFHICIIDDKEDKRDNGMIYTVNKWGSINLFCSYKRAYSHFIKNNWI